ncbi:hypothetical protein CALVIDRAFT_194273 [Calocera viscosa TUFC12733]|uniref:Uncharacterized protein n=1 Tax=Calocera viscosa (strain TUFC12733) TaxID=1330018 RepID=A0A167KRP7_CALVF|nr:hypothetical protein CALVIDRAFT_194273 [Calocera viscosa TUFC12733]
MALPLCYPPPDIPPPAYHGRIRKARPFDVFGPYAPPRSSENIVGPTVEDKVQLECVGPPGRCPDHSKKISSSQLGQLPIEPLIQLSHNLQRKACLWAGYITSPQTPFSLSLNKHLPHSHLQLSASPRST